MKLFIIIISCQLLIAREVKPVGLDHETLLKVGEKDRLYQKLTSNGLEFKDNFIDYNYNDSIRIAIYSRAIQNSTKENKTTFSFLVELNDQSPIQLEYTKKKASLVTSKDSLDVFTISGVHYFYIPAAENNFHLKIIPLGNNPQIFIRIISKLLQSENISKETKTLDRKQDIEIDSNQSIHCKLQSGVGYDSNYLKLSNSEQDEVSYYPALLGDSESISSLISKNTFEIKFNPYFFEDHETQIRLKINYNKYFVSAKKSYYSFGVYFAQHLGKYEWVKLSYSYLPQYYLRNYRDRDDLIINENSNAYLTSCYFSQGSTTIKYSKWLYLKKTWLEGIINYKTQYYNPAFTEFDLNLFSIGAQFHSRYFKKYSLKLGGYKTFAENTTNEEGLKSTLEIDRGFKQYDYLISLKTKLTVNYFKEVGVSYSTSVRNYSSTHLTDDLHNGRSHTENKLRIWVGDKLNNDVDYTIQFSKRTRKTDAAVDWIEELKDFEKWEVYLLFSYHFTSDILY